MPVGAGGRSTASVAGRTAVASDLGSAAHGQILNAFARKMPPQCTLCAHQTPAEEEPATVATMGTTNRNGYTGTNSST